jgi:precorrin-2 dehydrogenase/sirohydrochlorin ferrochelatase
MLEMRGRPAIVIGGGEVALRKVRDLVDAGALVTCVAPDMHPEIEILAREGEVENPRLFRRGYQKGDLAASDIAFFTADDRDVLNDVLEEARERKVLVNCALDPESGDFFVPSWERRGDLVLALATSGASPAYAARLRRELASNLPAGTERRITALREARQRILELDLYPDERSRIFTTLASRDDLLDELALILAEGKDLNRFLERVLHIESGLE